VKGDKIHTFSAVLAACHRTTQGVITRDDGALCVSIWQIGLWPAADQLEEAESKQISGDTEKEKCWPTRTGWAGLTQEGMIGQVPHRGILVHPLQRMSRASILHQGINSP